jgi:hypothetical protein
MHDIEPYHNWRDKYIASEDERSPFFGKQYDEFQFTQKIYNYFIHPQWDFFGSATLYMKILYVDYEEGFAVIEMMGEWNDCLHNDIMYLKREIADHLAEYGVHKYILICENVLNFHGSDDLYYEEWFEDVIEEGGWVCFINLLDHVEQEIRDTHIDRYVHVGELFSYPSWRTQKPKTLYLTLEERIHHSLRHIGE